MCDDLPATIKSLQTEKAPWGVFTSIKLPSGGELGLYQPTHPTAIGM